MAPEMLNPVVPSMPSSVGEHASNESQMSEEEMLLEIRRLMPCDDDLIKLAQLCEVPPELRGIQEEKPW